MKIVCVDNFGRDEVDDKLVCENVNKFYGEKIVEWLNDKYSGNHSPDYYRLEKDDYKLYKYEI